MFYCCGFDDCSIALCCPICYRTSCSKSAVVVAVVAVVPVEVDRTAKKKILLNIVYNFYSKILFMNQV